MLKGFRDFILRGNVLDLAVGVIIGGAFGTVVTSLVKDVFTPFIGSLVGKPDFSAIKAGPILVGNFLNAVIAFLMVAAAVYFFIVLPANAIMARMKKPEPPAAPATRPCPECLSAIPVAAKRCAFCAQPVA
ncbi:MAG TPA: large conductance mechanosensitive channel protein MscL [Terracidiphilus sp.]|jgi:large conductance mechanosensitive channel|nr:large conductance mechanosensitive channel protein MscL [Terracidiphilus sp.]